MSRTRVYESEPLDTRNVPGIGSFVLMIVGDMYGWYPAKTYGGSVKFPNTDASRWSERKHAEWAMDAFAEAVRGLREACGTKR